MHNFYKGQFQRQAQKHNLDHLAWPEGTMHQTTEASVPAIDSICPNESPDSALDQNIILAACSRKLDAATATCCPMCSLRCPADAPSCTRGERFFNEE